MKKVIKRLLIFLFAVVLFGYLGYAFLFSNFSVPTTEIIKSSRVADSISTTGFIIRNEKVIEAASNGYISYALENGEKINAGGTVAKIFSSEQATSNQISKDRLSVELEMLNRLDASAGNSVLSIDTVNSQITSAIAECNSAVKSGNYLKLWNNRNNILYLMNERQLVIGQQSNFNERIKQIKGEIGNISSDDTALLDTVNSSVAGFFTSCVDGYEASFSYDNALNITLDELNHISKKEISESSIGKVITDVNWYIACPVSAEQALAITAVEDNNVMVTFSSSSSSHIQASVAGINQPDKNSNGVVVLKCNYMNSVLSEIRQEDIKIDINYYEGLRIPKKALRTHTATKTVTAEDGSETKKEVQVQGVYILFGSEIKFRRVDIIYAAENFVICKTSCDDDYMYNISSVSLYDEVVTEGIDLYDGKIIK